MTTAPTSISEINAKIDNGQVKVKSERAKGKTSQAKAEKPAGATTPKHKAPSDDEFLKALKQIYAETKKATHSRTLSDKLGIKDSDFGRGAARAAMRRLAVANKVKIVTVSEGRTKFNYMPLEA